MVACDKTATVTTKYSVVVQASDEGVEPTVVTGETQATSTTKETLTKQPEKKKTAIQRYDEMEEDLISQTVMEGGSVRFSSSSSSNEGEPSASADNRAAGRTDPTVGKEKDLMPPPKETPAMRPAQIPGKKMTVSLFVNGYSLVTNSHLYSRTLIGVSSHPLRGLSKTGMTTTSRSLTVRSLVLDLRTARLRRTRVERERSPPAERKPRARSDSPTQQRKSEQD